MPERMRKAAGDALEIGEDAVAKESINGAYESSLAEGLLFERRGAERVSRTDTIHRAGFRRGRVFGGNASLS
jgi:hypothetical protein